MWAADVDLPACLLRHRRSSHNRIRDCSGAIRAPPPLAGDCPPPEVYFADSHKRRNVARIVLRFDGGPVISLPWQPSFLAGGIRVISWLR